MGIVVTGEETLADIDEVLRFVQTLLADPKLNPRRRILLLTELDALLDSRLEITKNVR